MKLMILKSWCYRQDAYIDSNDPGPLAPLKMPFVQKDMNLIVTIMAGGQLPRKISFRVRDYPKSNISVFMFAPTLGSGS
jgi:hypothetical protein